MKEEVMKTLEELGFQLTEEEGLGYSFDYEGLKCLWMYNEDDEEFLSICLPGIISMDDLSFPNICALMNSINSTMKYVKAYPMGKGVWIFYEREVLGEENNLEELIAHMILRLEMASNFARKEIEKLEAGDNEEEDEDEFDDINEEFDEDEDEFDDINEEFDEDEESGDNVETGDDEESDEDEESGDNEDDSNKVNEEEAKNADAKQERETTGNDKK